MEWSRGSPGQSSEREAWGKFVMIFDIVGFVVVGSLSSVSTPLYSETYYNNRAVYFFSKHSTLYQPGFLVRS